MRSLHTRGGTPTAHGAHQRAVTARLPHGAVAPLKRRNYTEGGVAFHDVSALIAASRPARRRDVSAAPPRPRAASAAPPPRVPVPGPRPARRARCRGSTSAASATRRGSGTWSGSSRATARSWRWISRTGERGPARPLLPPAGGARPGPNPGRREGRAGRQGRLGVPRGRAGPPRHLSRFWGQGGGAWGCGEVGGRGRLGSHGNGGRPLGRCAGGDRTPVFPWQRRGPCFSYRVLGGQVAGCVPPVGSGCPLGGSLVSPGPPEGEPGQQPQNPIGGQTPYFQAGLSSQPRGGRRAGS